MNRYLNFGKLLLVVLLFSLCQNLHAQKNVFKNLLSVKLENIEPIKVNSELKGYCMYYFLDDAEEKGMGNYKMIILDQDLNKVSEKSIVQSKDLDLVLTSYNGSSVLLIFKNVSKKVIVFNQYDLQCNLLSSLTVDSGIKELIYMAEYWIRPFVQPAEGKGYYFYTYFENYGFKYRVRYITSKGELAWTHDCEPDEKEEYPPLYLAANQTQILHHYFPGYNNSFMLTAYNATTGKQMYKKEFHVDKYKAEVFSAFPDSSGGFIICGQLHNDDKKIKEDYIVGLFIGKIDPAGKLVSSKTHLFDNVFAGKETMNNGVVGEKGFPYFHEAAQLKDGTIYFIGQTYKLFKKGYYYDLEMNDLMMVSFKQDMNLADVQFIKNKSIVHAEIKGSWQNDHSNIIKYMRLSRLFPYILSRKSDQSFTFFYTNQPNKAVVEGKNMRCTISKRLGEEGYLTDAIATETKADETYVLAAKAGHILFVEYTKKSRDLEMRLEKFNF